MSCMRIGEVAARAGVNVQTVRYYERRGILPPPPRSPSGYRQYGPDAVSRVRFVKRAQDLGFSLAEIQDLLGLRVEETSACSLVEARVREKIGQVERKIRELEGMKRVLEELVEACRARRPTEECPILYSLEGDEDA